MADHPLRPATDRGLGRPLPYQLANRTWAHHAARGRNPPFTHRSYAVLARVSPGCPPLHGRFPRVTHPSATLLRPKPFRVRLACVRHAASVQSEPGSNSSVLSLRLPKQPILARRNHPLLKMLVVCLWNSPATTEHPHKLSKHVVKELLAVNAEVASALPRRTILQHPHSLSTPHRRPALPVRQATPRPSTPSSLSEPAILPTPQRLSTSILLLFLFLQRPAVSVSLCNP